MVQADQQKSMNLSTNQLLTSLSTGPQKRKNSPQVKFYAVKAGYTPGIYLSWKECEQQISGFKGAAFKSFPTREEADAYLAGRASSSRSTQPSVQADKFYGVAKGRNPGVYTDWSTAQEQITGWKFPKYKKFSTRAEAEEFVRSGGKASIGPTLLKSGEDLDQNGLMADGDLAEDSILVPRVAKRPKYATTHENSADFGYGMLSEFEKDILDPVGPTGITKNAPKEVLRIHTDGSSLSNGQHGARAGLGVYFGPGDPRNVAERLPGALQTNQRGELAAILRALEISPMDHEVHIVTDSKYSVRCVTEWFHNWEKNKWQTSTKQPVSNKDLIQSVLARIRDREALGAATRFFWIKGHSNDPGNEAADRLAVLGARKPSVD